jgi:hypothetical protein
MSSSEEKIAGAYLWGLTITLASALGLVILLTWIVDPLGILRDDRGFPMFCADGIKTTNDRASVPLLPIKTDFNQVIIGSSRIKHGFTPETFQIGNDGKAINLGIAGLHITEAYRLLIPLIKFEKLEVLSIGLDFGMFATARSRRTKIKQRNNDSSTLWQSYRIGMLSFIAWRETIHVLKRNHSCLKPIRNYNGFNTDKGSRHHKERRPKDTKRQELRILKRYSQTKYFQPESYQFNLNLLKQLIDESAKHSVQIRLFINPSHPRRFELLQQTNHLDKYRQWERDLQTIIQGAQNTTLPPQFWNFSNWHSRSDFMPLGCYDNFSPPCPFFDLTHYRPQVGAQIMKALQEK